MKKMNNKGFSLVELIIVIAIMAVLIAVLAPQYLKYVEKSRVSADGQTADEFVSAFQVLASDPDVDLGSNTITANSDNTGKITINDPTGKLSEIMDTGKQYKYKSKTFKDANSGAGVKIELKWNSTKKIWEIDSNIPAISS